MTRWVQSLVLLAALSLAGCVRNNQPYAAGFAFQRGDLLFQHLDAGPLSEAIAKVTYGFDGVKFTHVGIVCEVGIDGPRSCRVLEAVSAGVRVTPLAEFLERSQDSHGQPRTVVGRLRARHQPLVSAALRVGLSLVGKTYDKQFVIDNDAYYCSELVYEMFAHAAGDESVFALEPMTFVDPDTDKIFPAWVEYFARLGLAVPEGEPGINPGGISRSPNIEIVHPYGMPDRRMP